MKYQFTVLAEIKCFERGLVTMEADSMEEAKKQLKDWQNYFYEIESIEFLMETIQDTGYYEVEEDTLEET
jgi:hypothetical protein